MEPEARTSFLMSRSSKYLLSGSCRRWRPLLCTEAPLSNTISIVILALSCIQMLALNFEAASLNLESGPNVTDTAISGVLSTILTRRKFDLLDLSSTDIIIIVAGTSYIMSFLILNGIVFYRATKRMDMEVLLGRIWKGSGYIHLFVFTLPVHNLATDFVYSSFNQSNYSAGSLIEAFIAILLAILNIILSIIQLKFSFVIKTKDPLSRTNNLYLFSFLITKLFQSTLNCLALRSQNTQGITIVATIIAFSFSIINQVILSSSCPFFKGEMNKIISYGGAVNIVASIIAIIFLSVIRTTTESANILILIFCFLIFATIGGKLNQIFFYYRLVRLNQKRLSSKLTSFQTYWWIQRFRFIKSLLSKTLVPDTSEKKFQMLGLFQAGLIKTLLRDLNISSHTVLNKEERRECLYQMFYNVVAHNPKNHLLRLVLTNYLIKDSNNIYGPSVLLQQTLLDKDAPFSIKLSAALLQKKIQDVIEKHIEHRNKEELNLKSYFHTTNIYEKFKSLIDEYLKLLERFYRLLEDMTINSTSLVGLSAKLQICSNRIHKYWDKIPYDITEKKGVFYITYAIFNTCFNYDPKKGTRYFNKYRSFVKKCLERFKSNIIDNKNLHDSHSMSFLLKTDLRALGEIVDCTSNVKNSLGYSKPDLVGKAINFLMPSFFQTIYTDLMRKKLNSNEELFNTEHIDSFAKDQNGFIVPINSILTIYPTLEDGLLFWSLMRKMDSGVDYMLVVDNGIIEGISRKLGDELGINPDEKITLNNVCPSLGKLEGIMELIFTGVLEPLVAPSDEEVESVRQLKVNTKSTIFSNRENGTAESVVIAQMVLQKGRIFDFKPRKKEMSKETLFYNCKCSFQSYQDKLLKIYTLQKVNAPSESKLHESIQHKPLTHTISRKESSEFNFSMDEFGQQGTSYYAPNLAKEASSEFNFSVDEFSRNSSRRYHVQPAETIFREKRSSTMQRLNTIGKGTANKVSIKNNSIAKPKALILKKPTSSSGGDSELSHTKTGGYQSSVRSEFSRSNRRGETLDNLLSYLKFYKFSELRPTFFLITVYLTILLAMIWVLCDEAINSIPLIKGTVEVFTIMLERANLVYSTMKNNYLSYALPILGIYDPIYSIGLASDLVKLADENAKLIDKIHNLEKETKELFYYDNVKIYYGGFSDIKNSTDYHVQDAIGSLYSIIAEGLYRSSHSVTTDNRSKYSEDFLYINLYNDYLIKNEELQGEISVDLNIKARNIAERCDLYITITSIFYGIAVLAITIVLYIIYKKTFRFLEDFVNGGYDHELSDLISLLNQYRLLIESDMDLSQSHKSPQKTFTSKNLSKLQNSTHYSKRKSIKGLGILSQYLTYYAITGFFLTLGLILLILASSTYKTRTQDILPLMNDIDQAAMISTHAQSVIAVLNLYIFKPSLYYKYNLPRDILEQYIEEMTDVVSFERTRFTPEFEQKMHSDFCVYVNLTLFEGCRTNVSGIALKGVVPSVIAIENILMSFKNSYDLIPESPFKMFASLLDDNLGEAAVLISDGLAPAISKIIDERSGELSDMVDETSKIVIKYGKTGVVLLFLMIIYVLMYLYPTLLTQRKTITKTILLLPPDLIIKNRYLKDFLLRQNKRFYTFIKAMQEQEQSYSIDSLIERRSGSRL